jgi:hypothetical protein
MTKGDRETLLQCANLIIEQAAALKYWDSVHHHGQITNIRSTNSFASLVEQSQPHLEQIENLVEHPLTDKAAFDTLRSFLKALNE